MAIRTTNIECPTCAYPLQNSSETFSCPECGRLICESDATIYRPQENRPLMAARIAILSICFWCIGVLLLNIRGSMMSRFGYGTYSTPVTAALYACLFIQFVSPVFASLAGLWSLRTNGPTWRALLFVSLAYGMVVAQFAIAVMVRSRIIKHPYYELIISMQFVWPLAILFFIVHEAEFDPNSKWTAVRNYIGRMGILFAAIYYLAAFMTMLLGSIDLTRFLIGLGDCAAFALMIFCIPGCEKRSPMASVS